MKDRSYNSYNHKRLAKYKNPKKQIPECEKIEVYTARGNPKVNELKKK